MVLAAAGKAFSCQAGTVITIDLTTLTDAELAMLEWAHPRDFANPLSVTNEYPNAIFAERQRRHEVGARAKARALDDRLRRASQSIGDVRA